MGTRRGGRNDQVPMFRKLSCILQIIELKNAKCEYLLDRLRFFKADRRRTERPRGRRWNEG
jgi:hypothetical protein